MPTNFQIGVRLLPGSFGRMLGMAEAIATAFLARGKTTMAYGNQFMGNMEVSADGLACIRLVNQRNYERPLSEVAKDFLNKMASAIQGLAPTAETTTQATEKEQPKQAAIECNSSYRWTLEAIEDGADIMKPASEPSQKELAGLPITIRHTAVVNIRKQMSTEQQRQLEIDSRAFAQELNKFLVASAMGNADIQCPARPISMLEYEESIERETMRIASEMVAQLSRKVR